MIGDRKSLGRVVFHQTARDSDGLVGRVVQDLNVEFVQRVLQAADGIQQPLYHELLIEDRKLYRHPGQLFKSLRWFSRTVFSVLVIEVYQHIAVHAVRCQQNQDNEVGNQQRRIERIGVIEALEGLVKKVLPEILTEAARDCKEGKGRNERATQR
jgi:hypothetical protein